MLLLFLNYLVTDYIYPEQVNIDTEEIYIFNLNRYCGYVLLKKDYLKCCCYCAAVHLPLFLVMCCEHRNQEFLSLLRFLFF